MYSYEVMDKLSKEYGEYFYIFDKDLFSKNFRELKSIFSRYYSRVELAYAYKSNYLMEMCKCVNANGGYSEICSELEYEIAVASGVDLKYIIMNGPCKDVGVMTKILRGGGIVNIDSYSEFESICQIAAKNGDIRMHLGIRCNMDLKDNRKSRFGLDIHSKEAESIFVQIKNASNMILSQIHCHIKGRSIETWATKAKAMIEIYDFIVNRYDIVPKMINLGGGVPISNLRYHGNEYAKFAENLARIFNRRFIKEKRPILLFEPGAAVSAGYMSFVTKVKDIKQIRGRYYGVLAGNHFFVNPINKKYPINIKVYHGENSHWYEKIELVGTTCMEDDFFCEYSGYIAKNDYVLFENTGAYTNVLKPPFINLNAPIICRGKTGNYDMVMRSERVVDIISMFQ